MTTITGFVTNIVINFSSYISHLPSNEAIIFDIGLILIISAIFAFLARVLRQPLIPAYVLTGLIIGPLVFGFVTNSDLVYAFSEIGIAFLLFTAGIEISFSKIKQANIKKILLIGTLQVLVVFLITLALGKYFDLTTMQAVYLGIILAFSSTMVDVKLLSDMGELVTMHGRLVLGVLLLQDLFAILAIIFLTSGNIAGMPVLIALAKLIGIFIFAVILQKIVINPLFRFAARSVEFLFLSSLAVLFLFVIASYLTGISIVIGAFIAGVCIANSPFKKELESRVSPLRDFFAILFFVSLGMQIVFAGIVSNTWLFVFLIVGALVIKPIITVILLRITGYRPKTSFITSISLAQLSEFSLIIGTIGLGLGILTKEIFSTIILATIITMSLTTYFILYKNQIYHVFRIPMKIFKFLPIKENLEYKDEKEKTIVLAGCHRMGSILVKEFQKVGKKDELLVIDYNPEIITALINKKISCIYGDLGSHDILDNLNFNKLKEVISTIPNIEDNLEILKKIKKRNPLVRVILTAERIDDALELYKAGADYVILPKIIAGEELIGIIHDGKNRLKEVRTEHIKKLRSLHNILY